MADIIGDQIVSAAEYEKLRKRVKSIIYYLESASGSIDSTIEELKKSYLYNDKTADNSYLLNAKSKIADITKSLRYPVLNEINNLLK